MGIEVFYPDPADRYLIVDNAAARTAITGAALIDGLMVYEKDTDFTYTYNGSAWMLTAFPKKHARIYQASNQNMVTGWNYISAAGVNFNHGGLNVGWHIILPYAGLWRVNGKAGISIANNPQHLIYGLMTDGSIYWRGTDQIYRGLSSGDGVTLMFDDVISVGASVTLYPQIYNGNANTCVLVGGAEHNHFEAEYLGLA